MSEGKQTRSNFLTVEQIAEQFDMYADCNTSVDYQKALRFAAKFLREFGPIQGNKYIHKGTDKRGIPTHDTPPN